MASTAADIIASAKAEAEAARQSALANLSGMGTDLTNAYNQQQSATTASYQNTLNQLQQAYKTDTKAAYGNYMGERQNLNNQLTRLGLQNSGYGVSQGLLAGAAYSKNLATLQSALSTNTANTNVQQQQALADLYNTYAKNKLSVDQYKYDAAQKAYDTAYANSYKAQQDEIANALQQQYYNYLMTQASNSGGGSGRGRSSNDDEELEGGYDVNTDYWQGSLNPDVQYGTFSTTDKNGVKYQPNNVGGNKLSKVKGGIKVGQAFGSGNKGSTGASLDNQYLWKAKVNGKTNYYVWDGSQNKYLNVTSSYKKK